MIRVTTKKKGIRIMIPPNSPFPRRSKPEKNKLHIEIGQMTKTSILFLLLLERKKRLRRNLQFPNKAEQRDLGLTEKGKLRSWWRNTVCSQDRWSGRRINKTWIHFKSQCSFIFDWFHQDKILKGEVIQSFQWQQKQ